VQDRQREWPEDYIHQHGSNYTCSCPTKKIYTVRILKNHDKTMVYN